MLIEECYTLICSGIPGRWSCGDRIRDEQGRICTCDCERDGHRRRRPKRLVLIEAGCTYCSRQKALLSAAVAVTSDPELREIMRRDDEAQSERPLSVLPPSVLPPVGLGAPPPCDRWQAQPESESGLDPILEPNPRSRPQ